MEGRLTLKEAGLLEGVCEEMREQSEAGLCIDLSAITFLDSESAAVLCRLREQGIALEGLELFVQRMVELAEKR